MNKIIIWGTPRWWKTTLANIIWERTQEKIFHTDNLYRGTVRQFVSEILPRRWFLYKMLGGISFNKWIESRGGRGICNKCNRKK